MCVCVWQNWCVVVVVSAAACGGTAPRASASSRRRGGQDSSLTRPCAAAGPRNARGWCAVSGAAVMASVLGGHGCSRDGVCARHPHSSAAMGAAVMVWGANALVALGHVARAGARTGEAEARALPSCAGALCLRVCVVALGRAAALGGQSSGGAARWPMQGCALVARRCTGGRGAVLVRSTATAARGRTRQTWHPREKARA